MKDPQIKAMLAQITGVVGGAGAGLAPPAAGQQPLPYMLGQRPSLMAKPTPYTGPPTGVGYEGYGYSSVFAPPTPHGGLPAPGAAAGRPAPYAGPPSGVGFDGYGYSSVFSPPQPHGGATAGAAQPVTQDIVALLANAGAPSSGGRLAPLLGGQTPPATGGGAFGALARSRARDKR